MDVDPPALPYIIGPTAERWLSFRPQVLCVIPDHSLLQMLAATGAGSFPPADGERQAGMHV